MPKRYHQIRIPGSFFVDGNTNLYWGDAVWIPRRNAYMVTAGSYEEIFLDEKTVKELAVK